MPPKNRRSQRANRKRRPEKDTQPKSVMLAGWVGMLFGITGSLLLALKLSYSGFGFLFYLGSNAAWIYHGVKTKTWSMVTMSIGYTVISLIGVINWVV